MWLLVEVGKVPPPHTNHSSLVCPAKTSGSHGMRVTISLTMAHFFQPDYLNIRRIFIQLLQTGQDPEHVGAGT